MAEEKSTKDIVQEYVNKLKDSHYFITLKDTSELFWYRKEVGYYIPGEIFVKEIANVELGKDATQYIIKEIIHKLKNSTYVDRTTPPENLIPLKNGLYDVKKGELIEHSSEYQFFGQHPIEYKPDALCPTIEKYLKDVSEGNQEKINKLVKLAGYCFYRKLPDHKIFILLGNGRNGKGVYGRLLRNALGPRFVSAVKMHILAKDRFASADLFGMNLNFAGELNSKKIESTAELKDTSGGDLIRFQRKHGQPFFGELYVKQVYTGNDLPEHDDKSLGMSDRLVLITFDKTFSHAERDPNLDQKLSTPEELSGFFNIAMEGLEKILEGEAFDERTPEERALEYEQKSSSTLGFFGNMIIISKNAETSKEDIWEAYLSFCSQSKKPHETQTKFWTSFKNHFKENASEIQLRDGRKRFRAWRGIQLKDIEPDKEQGARGLEAYSARMGKTDYIEANTPSNPVPIVPKSDLIQIRILSELPSFVGSDTKNYGPFSEGEIANIPTINAKLIVAKKLGVMV